MPVKKLRFRGEARLALKRGVDAIAEAVGATLGPRGRNVLVDIVHGPPQVTHDGATIAREVDLADRFENMGVQLIKEAVEKTNKTAGDGTTTAAVLAQAIVDEALRNVVAGANPMLLKRGLDRALETARETIRGMAVPLQGRDDVVRVAIGSLGDPELGTLVGDLVHRVGRDGIVSIEDSRTLATETEYVDGMVWNRGYVSAYFTTDENQLRAELEEPAILLTDKKINTLSDFLPALEMLLAQGKKEFVLICDDVEGEALSTLVANKQRGLINPVAVKAPAFGDLRHESLLDLAALTGGQVISDRTGRPLSSASLEDLGQARRVVATMHETSVIDGYGPSERIDERIERIKTLLDLPTTLGLDREKLEERLAALSGGVGVVKVGAATEVELMEKRRRVEDALAATKAAKAEGIVPGGGVALLAAAASLDPRTLEGDEAVGVRVLQRALEAPIRRIARNAGFDGSVVVGEVRRIQRETGNVRMGFDALSGEYGDVVERGIVDPVKVTLAALQHAASVAGMILTTEALIGDK